MKIAICDDDIRISESIAQMLSGEDYADTVEVYTYSSAQELTEACRETEFDMVFMDIMLGGENGITTAKEVDKLIPGVRVVFITAHLLDFAEKIFSGIRPYGYIGKPLEEAKIRKCIERVTKDLNRQNRLLTVRLKGVEYQLSLSAVWYIESRGRKAFVHCGSEVIEIYDRLDNIWEQLDERFVRCHQSYIVNLDRVTELSDEGLVVDSAEEGDAPVVIRISRNRMHDTRQKYFEHKGRAMI